MITKPQHIKSSHFISCHLISYHHFIQHSSFIFISFHIIQIIYHINTFHVISHQLPGKYYQYIMSYQSIPCHNLSNAFKTFQLGPYQIKSMHIISIHIGSQTSHIFISIHHTVSIYSCPLSVPLSSTPVLTSVARSECPMKSLSSCRHTCTFTSLRHQAGSVEPKQNKIRYLLQLLISASNS